MVAVVVVTLMAQPPSHERLLPESTDCWEPALAAGPNGRVYVVAGRRHGMPRDKDFEQQQVIGRSEDGGATFEPPRLMTAEGHSHYDQRIAVDADGTVYVSYMDWEKDATGRSSSRLRLARSRDEGRTFTPQTVTTHRVSDKPELAVSSDGKHLYIVYDDIIVAASTAARACAVWVDDRRGGLDVWARCSLDGGRTWGSETLLSDRADGAAYKSATGFKAVYGHYGGAAIDASGRLHAAWGAGEPGYRTGSVWVNSVDVSGASRR